jgi:hypothetical protein
MAGSKPVNRSDDPTTAGVSQSRLAGALASRAPLPCFPGTPRISICPARWLEPAYRVLASRGRLSPRPGVFSRGAAGERRPKRSQTRPPWRQPARQAGLEAGPRQDGSYGERPAWGQMVISREGDHSMSRFRLVLLSMLAVLALSAVASTSASAHGFSTTGEFLGTSGQSLLVSPALGIEIECQEDVAKGKLEAGGKTTGEATFRRCRVVTPAGCKVKEPISFSFTDLLVGTEGAEPVKDEFKPTEAEEVFVKITIEGCAAEGVYKVKGTQVSDLPAAGQSRAVHEIVSTPYGSKLKLGTSAAYFFSTETVRLLSGEPWSAS